MLLPPKLHEYRFAVYFRGHLIELTDKPAQPVALYRDEPSAIAHGRRMRPSTYTVVDLAEDERA